MWCILRIRPGPTANRTGDPSDPSDPASPFRLCFGSGLCTDQRTNERTNEIYWKQWQFRTEQETIDRRERETDALSVILRIHQWPISTKICCFVLLFGITRLVSSSLVFFSLYFEPVSMNCLDNRCRLKVAAAQRHTFVSFPNIFFYSRLRIHIHEGARLWPVITGPWLQIWNA